MTRFLAILFVALAIVGCKDKDRRRDRPRAEEPRQQQSIIGKIFEIPACGVGKLGYVTMAWPTPLEAGQTMRIEFSFEQSGDAKVVDNEDRRSTPGNMALFFQREGDDYSNEKYNRGYRQWSNPRQLATPGDHVFEVELLPANWNFGLVNFVPAMRDVENVGFTLAGYGGPSAGHGVCMASGTAKLTITNFTVE